MRRTPCCEAEGRDGTRLPACFKVYLPEPDGKFGMVLALTGDELGLGLGTGPSFPRLPPSTTTNPSLGQTPDHP
jgi:hypothetical protein